MFYAIKWSEFECFFITNMLYFRTVTIATLFSGSEEFSRVCVFQCVFALDEFIRSTIVYYCTQMSTRVLVSLFYTYEIHMYMLTCYSYSFCRLSMYSFSLECFTFYARRHSRICFDRNTPVATIRYEGSV